MGELTLYVTLTTSSSRNPDVVIISMAVCITLFSRFSLSYVHSLVIRRLQYIFLLFGFVRCFSLEELFP